jgi:hypothetical protein
MCKPHWKERFPKFQRRFGDFEHYEEQNCAKQKEQYSPNPLIDTQSCSNGPQMVDVSRVTLSHYAVRKLLVSKCDHTVCRLKR